MKKNKTLTKTIRNFIFNLKPSDNMEKKKKRSGNKTDRRGHRSLRDFDPKLFENLCKIDCTVNEIESVLDADQRTLDKWCKRHYDCSFSTMYQKLKDGGKASLRRIQWRHADKSPQAAMWLGKQLLGQSDKKEVKVTSIDKEDEITQNWDI